MKMKTTLLVLFAFVLHLAAADTPQTGRGEEAMKAATDKFMTRATQKEVAEAMGELFDQYWYDRADLANTKATVGAQFEAELKKAEIAYGKPLPKGIEFLGVKRVGKSTVKFVYLQKHEKFVVPWSFTFYRARDEFKLTSYAFANNAGEDMKDLTITEPAR